MNARGSFWVLCALGSLGCGASYATPSAKDEPITVQYSQSVAGPTVSEQAQFFSGDLTPGNGPELFHILAQNPTVIAGGEARSLDGDAGPTAYAVALRLKDAGTGYFVAKINLPDPNDPPNLNWTANIRFSESAPLGEQTIVAAAIDGAGRFGPISEKPFTIVPPISLDADTVISLVWATHADLDLHVRAPNGKEVDPKHPNTLVTVPPNYNPQRDGPLPGNGTLDHDANANCVYDGVIRENLTFADAPVPGSYQIRVDEFSACGVAATTFRVEIYHKGTLGEAIAGQLLDINADGGGPGSGIFVGERTF